MAVSVERLYRVTIGTRALTLDGEETLSQAKSLLTALGIAPSDVRPDAAEVITADISPPAQLPSGPVAEQTDNPPPVETAAVSGEAAKGRAVVAWEQADTDRLRALAGAGLTGPQIAAAMGKPKSTVYGKAGQHRIAIGAKHEAAPIAAPAPPAEPAPGAPVEPLLGRPSDWSVAETKALIREMGTGGGGFKAAAEKTGHGMGSCALRWKHLKQAGSMTVERYMSSPEAQA
jgi:hypothetical protein